MTTTPLTDQQLRDAVVAAIIEDGFRPRAERVGLVEAMLAVVRPELDRLTTAFEVAVSQCAKAQDKRDKHKQRAQIANTELEALRGGLREIGGDPAQVQNLYAQLSLRGRQLQEAKAEGDQARAERAQHRDQVLTEAAELIRADAEDRYERSYSDNRIFEHKGSNRAADLLLAARTAQPGPR